MWVRDKSQRPGPQLFHWGFTWGRAQGSIRKASVGGRQVAQEAKQPRELKDCWRCREENVSPSFQKKHKNDVLYSVSGIFWCRLSWQRVESPVTSWIVS